MPDFLKFAKGLKKLWARPYSENAQKVIDILEAAEDNTITVGGTLFYFDMAVWSSPSERTTGYEHRPCGTVGCIRGIVRKLSGAKNRDEAISWLGISEMVAHELFLLEIPVSKISSKMAAKAVRFAVKCKRPEEMAAHWQEIYIQSLPERPVINSAEELGNYLQDGRDNAHYFKAWHTIGYSYNWRKFWSDYKGDTREYDTLEDFVEGEGFQFLLTL